MCQWVLRHKLISLTVSVATAKHFNAGVLAQPLGAWPRPHQFRLNAGMAAHFSLSTFSGPGMGLVVDPHQMNHIQVSVLLGRRQTGMT